MIPLKEACDLVNTRITSIAQETDCEYGATASPDDLRLLFVGMDVDPDEVMTYSEILVMTMREAVNHGEDIGAVLHGAFVTAVATAIMAVTHDSS